MNGLIGICTNLLVKGMTVSSYKTHLSYNNNQNVSYKEGWALFQANRSTWGYNMNTKLDTTVQTSNFKNHKFGNKQKLLVNLQMLQFTMY